MDFSYLHKRQCEGVDNPGSSKSDYELWTPHDGRHNSDNKCFLGQQVTYIRRKQDSQCFNGEDLERIERREPCACNDIDYECDWGYTRQQGSKECKLDASIDLEQWNTQVVQRQQEQCEEYGYYEVTQGYRKVPGNICTGGIQLQPTLIQCSSSFTEELFTWTGLFMTAICCAVLYYGWPVIEAILIMLPIPDPKMLKEKSGEYASQAWAQIGGLYQRGKSLGG